MQNICCFQKIIYLPDSSEATLLQIEDILEGTEDALEDGDLDAAP